MKTSITILAFMLASIYANAQNDQKKGNEDKGDNINWLSSTTYDFGSVKKGTPVSSTFEFSNNGNEQLIISEAKGSCGCTSVEYSNQPIAPGEKGFVKATFNAASIGVFQKSITVTFNTAKTKTILYIKGQVVE